MVTPAFRMLRVSEVANTFWNLRRSWNKANGRLWYFACNEKMPNRWDPQMISIPNTVRSCEKLQTGDSRCLGPDVR